MNNTRYGRGGILSPQTMKTNAMSPKTQPILYGSDAIKQRLFSRPHASPYLTSSKWNMVVEEMRNPLASTKPSLGDERNHVMSDEELISLKSLPDTRCASYLSSPDNMQTNEQGQTEEPNFIAKKEQFEPRCINATSPLAIQGVQMEGLQQYYFAKVPNTSDGVAVKKADYTMKDDLLKRHKKQKKLQAILGLDQDEIANGNSNSLNRERDSDQSLFEEDETHHQPDKRIHDIKNYGVSVMVRNVGSRKMRITQLDHEQSLAEHSDGLAVSSQGTLSRSSSMMSVTKLPLNN